MEDDYVIVKRVEESQKFHCYKCRELIESEEFLVFLDRDLLGSRYSRGNFTHIRCGFKILKKSYKQAEKEKNNLARRLHKLQELKGDTLVEGEL